MIWSCKNCCRWKEHVSSQTTHVFLQLQTYTLHRFFFFFFLVVAAANTGGKNQLCRDKMPLVFAPAKLVLNFEAAKATSGFKVSSSALLKLQILLSLQKWAVALSLQGWLRRYKTASRFCSRKSTAVAANCTSAAANKDFQLQTAINISSCDSRILAASANDSCDGGPSRRDNDGQPTINFMSGQSAEWTMVWSTYSLLLTELWCPVNHTRSLQDGQTPS